MKIYISGQITGLSINEAIAIFEDAELKVREFLPFVKPEAIPVNPMKILPYHPDLTWKDYMIADIKELFNCDGIYMIKNWRNSKGARIEHAIAVETGMKIYYQENGI